MTHKIKNNKEWIDNKSNYSSIDKLYHNIFFNAINHNILYNVEKFFFKKKINLENIIFICGVPRSGTTAFLRNIYSTNLYASLTYNDVPSLFAPNLFNLFKLSSLNRFSPLRERSHQDLIKINNNSPEAFDEVFLESFLKEKKFTKDVISKIKFHNFSKEALKEYLIYIQLICLKYKKNKYVTKNNSNLFRLNSLAKNFPKSIIFILIRSPLYAAFSLLKLHLKYTNIDKFTFNYLDFLCHYEFGDNIKDFYGFTSKFNRTSINYWLDFWFFVHEKIFPQITKFRNIYLIPYEELTNIKLQNQIKNLLGHNLSDNFQFLNMNKKLNKKELIGINRMLLQSCNLLYDEIKNSSLLVK